jgi:hypothetical protein
MTQPIRVHSRSFVENVSLFLSHAPPLPIRPFPLKTKYGKKFGHLENRFHRSPQPTTLQTLTNESRPWPIWPPGQTIWPPHPPASEKNQPLSLRKILLISIPFLISASPTAEEPYTRASPTAAQAQLEKFDPKSGTAPHLNAFLKDTSPIGCRNPAFPPTRPVRTPR